MALLSLRAQDVNEWQHLPAQRNRRQPWLMDGHAANVSPTTMGGLAELAKLGLRDDLAAFYRVMQKEMPASHAPARAPKWLKL
jgi:hypothetical protein